MKIVIDLPESIISRAKGIDNKKLCELDIKYICEQIARSTVLSESENNLTEKEVMIKRLSELPDEVIATAVVYATDFTKLGADVTQQWNTAQKQHSELSKAYYRGYYDAMKRINDHLE